MSRPSTLSGRVYLGPCLERFQLADGTIELRKLYVWLDRGERQFSLTEEAARRAVQS